MARTGPMRRANLTILAATAAVFSACVPASTGPRAPRAEVPVAVGLTVALDEKGVKARADGTTRIAGRGAEAFRIVATTKIERHPYPGESLTAILTSGERVVKQTPFVIDALHGRARLEVPGPGTYRLEIWSKGSKGPKDSTEQFVAGNTFVAASLPRLDGQRALELHQAAGPQLVIAKAGAGGHVRWMHWDSVETDTGFVAEWWHDGKAMTTAGGKRSEFQREALLQVQISDQIEGLANQNVWRWTTEQFELPDQLTASPGPWELRVYREDRPGVTFSFNVTDDGLVQGAQRRTMREGSLELEVSAAPTSRDAARQLAKLPRIRFEASKKYLLPVTVAEVRALTRSEVLRGLRTRLNKLQRQTFKDAADSYQFGEADESPQTVEARKLVPVMQKMILALGEPWTPSERP